MWEDVFRTSQVGLKQVASRYEAWDLEFEFYAERLRPTMGVEDVELFMDGVLATAAQLEDLNETMMIPVYQSNNVRELIDTVRSLRAEGITGQEAYDTLMGLELVWAAAE